MVGRAIAALRPDGSLVLVEHGADRGSSWVPSPLGSATWERSAHEVGIVRARQLGSVPGRFLGSIYSAASDRA